MLRASIASLFLLVVSASAAAQVSAVGRYKEWRVFTEKTEKGLVCYAAVEADDMSPKSVDHGDVNFYIASWKSGGSSNQPSLKVGYNLRADLAPEAIIGRDHFRMYAAGPEAFFPDDEEKRVLAAIKKGSELRIQAAGVKLARTAYHFSLKGAAEAMDKAKALCR